MIAGFYLTYVIFDSTMQVLGNAMFEPDIDFRCEGEGRVVVPTTDGGAWFMLAHSLLTLSFTVMVLLVFYKIPDTYRLVAHPLQGDVKIQQRNVHSISLDDSMDTPS